MSDKMYLLLIPESCELFLYVPAGTKETLGRAVKIKLTSDNRCIFSVEIEMKRDDDAEKATREESGNYKIFRGKRYNIPPLLSSLIKKLLDLEGVEEGNTKSTRLRSEIFGLKAQLNQIFWTIIKINKTILRQEAK